MKRRVRLCSHSLAFQIVLRDFHFKLVKCYSKPNDVDEATKIAQQQAELELDIIRNQKKKKAAENKGKQGGDPTKKRKTNEPSQNVQAIGLSTSDGFYVVSKKVHSQ